MPMSVRGGDAIKCLSGMDNAVDIYQQNVYIWSKKIQKFINILV